eukprot:916862-Amphidinium_carterae.1
MNTNVMDVMIYVIQTRSSGRNHFRGNHLKRTCNARHGKGMPYSVWRILKLWHVCSVWRIQ